MGPPKSKYDFYFPPMDGRIRLSVKPAVFAIHQSCIYERYVSCFRCAQTLRVYDVRQNAPKRVVPCKMAQLDCCFKDTAGTGFCGGLDTQVKQ